MSALEFDLDAGQVCADDNVAKFDFARIYKMQGSAIRRSPLVTLPAGLLDGNRRRADRLKSATRQVVESFSINPRHLVMAAFYRLHAHQNEAGDEYLLTERHGIVVASRPGARRLPIVPRTYRAKADAHDQVIFKLDDILHGSVNAVVYPTTEEESLKFPITEVLAIPTSVSQSQYGIGYIALRGNELMMSVDSVSGRLRNTAPAANLVT